MSDSHYDLTIVGAGPGGYVSAIRAAHPEIATIGLTEAEAEARGIPIRMGRFPFAAIGKALAQGETDGFVKLIAHAETGQLLGGHAAEFIGHPTLSEAILEAAESLFGQSTHLPKPRERK